MVDVTGSGTYADPYRSFVGTAKELWNAGDLFDGQYFAVGLSALRITDVTESVYTYQCTIPEEYGANKFNDTTTCYPELSGTLPVTIKWLVYGSVAGTKTINFNVRASFKLTLAGNGIWYTPGEVATPTSAIYALPGATWNTSGNYLYVPNGMPSQVYFSADQQYTFNNITPASGTLNSDTTVTANTTHVPPTYYTLSFDANGGSGAPSMISGSSYSSSYLFTIPSVPTPTRAGYVFLGWRTSPDGTYPSYKPGNGYRVYSTNPYKTLYAVWGYELTFSTSPDGVGTLSTETVLAEQGATYTVSANSITIGNVSSVTVTASNGGVFEFSRWSYQGTTLSSGTITSAMHITAEWYSDTPTPSYPTEFLPKAAVRIYKAVDSTSYYDVTYKMTSQPKVYKAVNRAGNFSFSISIDPDDSPLSPSFDGWTDGATGAVDWGMYVIVEAINSDGTTTYVTDGYIATMELSEYTLSIQCADHLAILGSRGADIHRNYYDARTANEVRGVIVGQASDNYIDVDVTNIYDFGGTIDTSTVRYRVDSTTPYEDGSERLLLQSGSSLYSVTWSISLTKPFKGIKFKMWKAAGSYSGMCTVNGTSYPWSYSSSSSGDFDLTVDFGQVLDAGNYTIKMMATSSGTFNNGTLQVYAKTSSGTGTIVHSYGNTTYNNANVYCTIYDFTDATVTSSITASGGKTYLHITAVTGSSITTDYGALTIPSDSRVSFAYVSGTVSATAIISNIASRAKYAPTIATDAMSDGIPEFKLFRTGGGYALDYLQKVADTGHAMTFAGSGFAAPTLHVGARRTSANGATYETAYGNAEQVGNSLIMYDFKPRKTMQNRPSRALIRTAISSQGETTSKPVIALVYNHPLVSSRHNVSTDTVVSNSSVLSVLDAVRSAYSSVYVDEEDWEGVLTLSGIIPDMIDATGAYAGSGKVISVTDPRYGFVSKRFVITDVTLDFESITTQVTLSNAAQVYSSAVNDSIATAYTAADLAVGDAETTAYNTQFVYVQTTSATVQSSNSISITTSTGTYSLSNISAYVMQGHTLVYGSITFTSANKSTAKYDGLSVTLNGTTIGIPSEARPDCYEDQTVIVNIDVIQA